MGPQIEPSETDERVPARADVVIVGGGIVGVSAALALARKGISVVLCEKGVLAGEQSSRNWGWCRQTGRHESEIPLAQASLRLWDGMNALTGKDVGFQRTGVCYLCDNDAELARRAAWLEKAKPYGVDTVLIGQREIGRVAPGAAVQYKGALYSSTDGRAEPQQATSALASAARGFGAVIAQHRAVRGLEFSAGRACAVVTERETIACSSVLIAAGAWSRLFCGNLGLDLPQLKVLGSVLRTAPLDTPLQASTWAGRFAFRKRLDGGYTVANAGISIASIVPDSFRLFFDYFSALAGERRSIRLRVDRRFIEEWRMPKRWKLDEETPFERVRVLDPEPDHATNVAALASLKRAFPSFREARIVQEWGGLIDVTPDAVPVIGAVPGIPGLFLATGFSGHGFGIGPAAGQLSADIIANDEPIVDPKPFDLGRFRRLGKAIRSAS